MKEDTAVCIEQPEATKDALTEVLREGAQKLLEAYQEERDGQGRQRWVRNGSLPQRESQTGMGGSWFGSLGSGQESEEIIRFRSGLVPPYLRRSKSLEEFSPLLYLKGVSTGGLHRRAECATRSGWPRLVCQDHQPA